MYIDGGLHLRGIILTTWKFMVIGNKEITSENWSQWPRMVDWLIRRLQLLGWSEAGARGVPGVCFVQISLKHGTELQNQGVHYWIILFMTWFTS